MSYVVDKPDVQLLAADITKLQFALDNPTKGGDGPNIQLYAADTSAFRTALQGHLAFHRNNSFDADVATITAMALQLTP